MRGCEQLTFMVAGASDGVEEVVNVISERLSIMNEAEVVLSRV